MAFLAIRSIFLFLIAGLFPLASILHGFSFKKKRKENHYLEANLAHDGPYVYCCSYGSVLHFDKEHHSYGKDSSTLYYYRSPFLLSAAGVYVLWKDRAKQDELRGNARNLFATLLLLLLVPIGYLYFNNPLVNPALKKSIDIIEEDSAGRLISLWTGYNNGPYAEFRGIPCYMDTRAEVFLPKLNQKKMFSQNI